ncbi:MAG: right-handed parallel beta-helix repeat-containing protein [Chloroflexi bacterium]|nr:right-handed parallel beta-helix repeat-containing protein [Chloroflexota bacterium]
MKAIRALFFGLLGTAVLFSLFSFKLMAQETAVTASGYAPATTIIVNSGKDLDTSDGTTCATQPCTLRRAVIQARTSPKPVLITFDIPATAEEGYNSTLQIWKIQFSGISSAANATLRYLNGDITIDGSTQPGGRTTDPKIILVGPGTGQWDGLKLGETGVQNNNQIRGLGFQMFKTHIYVNSSGNLIEDNWFGLSDDGTNIVLRGGGQNDGSGNTGISVGANIANNVIQNNVFTGLAGVAAAINGNDTTFANNYVGTIANGTVPDKTTDPSLICLQWDWLGGSGISLSGSRNLVENNIFAGLRIAVSPPTIQADTIRMGGSYHIIRDNKIGLDAANAEIGVCGRGIYLLSSTKFNQITTNQIIRPGLSAISLNDTPVVSTSDANTLRGNVIKKLTPWGEIEGNNSPEDAIQMTKSLPDAFRNFKPAQVTSISGTAVSGTSGAGSPCPNCIVELFLDDTDTITETLQSLAVVTANANGNWSATLPAALTAGQGLRTTSTSAQHNTIPGMSLGTTTGLSGLYTPGYKVYLPMVRK